MRLHSICSFVCILSLDIVLARFTCNVAHSYNWLIVSEHDIMWINHILSSVWWVIISLKLLQIMLLSTFHLVSSVSVCMYLFGSIPSSRPYRSQSSSTLGDVNLFPKILYQLHFYNQSMRVLIVSTSNSQK